MLIDSKVIILDSEDTYPSKTLHVLSSTYNLLQWQFGSLLQYEASISHSLLKGFFLLLSLILDEHSSIQLL